MRAKVFLQFLLLLILPNLCAADSTTAPRFVLPCPLDEGAPSEPSSHEAKLLECVGKVESRHLKAAISAGAFEASDSAEEAWLFFRAAFRTLHARGDVSPSDWRAYLRIVYLAWRFEELPGLQSLEGASVWISDLKVPQLRPIAPSLDAELRFWSINHEAGALTEATVRHKNGDFILVVFSPHCNPCRRAARDIMNSPELGLVFRHCSLWTAAMEPSFDFRQFEAWRNQLPFTPLMIRDWSQYRLSPPKLTPSFYIFVDGKPIRRLDGWPHDDAITRFKANLGSDVAKLSCASAAKL